MMKFFRSMAGRVFLILLCGIVVSVSLTWWLAIGERQRAITQLREARAVEQAEQFIRTLDEIPQEERHGFLRSTRRFGLGVELLNEGDSKEGVAPEDGLGKVLSERLGNAYRVLSLPADSSDCPPLRGRRARMDERREHGQCEVLQVRLQDASEVRISFLQPRGAPPPLRPDFNLYLVFFLCSIAALAYFVSRITTRPLRQLAEAANDLGKDIDRPPLPQKGTSEIRQATAAFNAMQERIKGHIRQRTHMLAAITHDLQTPLTRLRLRLEKVNDAELKNKLIEDLSQTQALVREGLELARSMDLNEPMQPLDIDSLLDSVCADAIDAGQSVTLQGNAHASVLAHPASLRRCLANLVDNAVKYGGSAEIAVRAEGEQRNRRIHISIADHGPGIPDDQLEKVFEPFYRIETSRSRETGGTGLGLTIARNIITQHGGSIKLANRKEGGLEVTLTLPAKQAF
ncbi:ATP-binding protein [Oxalobacteraceae bacterium R-40]|uniref:histidine kinase n=1 Tax=Keguizhuia sedimenti TaxID=3064264 RepID=A0ABU1BK25_9BURK|nr:ATP-binding protein [Oxalobacteraceae bacterium R-40]